MGLVIALAAGALIGLIAWAVLALLPDPWQASRTPIAIVIAIVWGLYAGANSSVDADHVEAELLKNDATRELAQAWKQADPDGFSAFAKHVLDAGVNNSLRSAVTAGSRDLNVAVLDRLPRLSDAEIVALEQNTRDLLLYFAEHAPASCFAIAHGGPSALTEQQIRNAPEELKEIGRRRLGLITAAFRADASAQAIVLNEADRARELALIGEALRAKLNDDALILFSADPAIAAQHQRRYCEVMAEYENQLSLSPRAGPLYRSVLQVASANRARQTQP